TTRRRAGDPSGRLGTRTSPSGRLTPPAPPRPATVPARRHARPPTWELPGSRSGTTVVVATRMSKGRRSQGRRRSQTRFVRRRGGRRERRPWPSSAVFGVGDGLLAHPHAQGVLELDLLDEDVVLG